MGNDEGLLAEVRDAGERAGERCWPLPLWDEYRELLKSDIADVKNSGGRGAGTIAGGWFLREFVNGFPWVHLDIAGTAYTAADSFAFSNAQTLADLLAHIPGVYVARGGMYGQAEVVLYGGRGPAGVEVYWDGVPYLPLGRDSVYLDLGRISLAPLERVDVLVLPATLRVYLVTARQQSTATASQVRIATGQARTANYRGSYERRWRSGLGLS